jgi:hypothetical protein
VALRDEMRAAIDAKLRRHACCPLCRRPRRVPHLRQAVDAAFGLGHIAGSRRGVMEKHESNH